MLPAAGRCYYTPLPRLVKRAGLTPAELTALNMDKSPLLEELIQSNYKGNEDALLGGWLRDAWFSAQLDLLAGSTA